MRILVDTSVWSLSLRKGGPPDHPTVRKLSALIDSGEELVLSGLILQEVLQAFRSDTTFQKVVKHLEPFPLLELTRNDYISAAQLHRTCAGKGIVVSTADCQIATAAIQHRCLLLTADTDFERIAKVCAFKLV